MLQSWVQKPGLFLPPQLPSLGWNALPGATLNQKGTHGSGQHILDVSLSLGGAASQPPAPKLNLAYPRAPMMMSLRSTFFRGFMEGLQNLQGNRSRPQAVQRPLWPLSLGLASPLPCHVQITTRRLGGLVLRRRQMTKQPPHTLPSLLLGVSLGLEGWWPHGTGSPLTFSSNPPCSWRQQPGTPRLDWTEQRPCRQTSPELGWRAVREEEMGAGQGAHCSDRREASGGAVPSPSPRCCCLGRIKRLFSHAAGGGVTGTCFWKAAWQPIESLKNVPALHF